MEILTFDKLASTNVHALELVEQGSQVDTVVWAREQTAGRGQYDRQFASPPGGLYFSLIFQPDLPLHIISLVTLAAGVGCCLCLEDTFKLTPLLKWPNDLYLRGKKLGGILTQALPLHKGDKSTVVIGVGLNVNSHAIDFPHQLQPAIATIADSTSYHCDLRGLLESMLAAIISQVHLLEKNQDKLLALWDERDYLKGQSLAWDNGQTIISGTGQGVLSDGRYTMIDRSGTTHEILAGTLRPS
jgi:BirA family biotin operon repressor/biotin-[acetyl-CoA-carboxylase] ligase